FFFCDIIDVLYFLFIFFFFFLILPPPPRSTLFPYTTLFRSWSGMNSSISSLYQIFGSITMPIIFGFKKNFPEEAPSQEYSLNPLDRKSTRLNSSHVAISYAVFCLKKKKKKKKKKKIYINKIY